MDQGYFYAEVIVDVDQMGEAGGGVTERRMENSIAAGVIDHSCFMWFKSLFLIKE